ncbi:MAG: hypothetical protein JXR59_02420 [Desulfuromonadaceae bacterium]|nr:hypothetical protein [Desulfuromonadaceae bacterium]
MTMKKLMATLAVAALSFGIFAGTAVAETTTDTIDVYAGVSSVMELNCTDLNYGVWIVPTGSRGNTTVVTLTSDNNTSITSGSSTGIALSANYAAPAASSCTVTGSTAADGTTGQVNFTGTGTFVANTGGTGFNAESIPAPSAALTTFYYALAHTTPTAMSSGATSFTVHGTINIPDGLTTANYGGYMAPAVIVSYEDVNE